MTMIHTELEISLFERNFEVVRTIGQTPKQHLP